MLTFSVEDVVPLDARVTTGTVVEAITVQQKEGYGHAVAVGDFLIVDSYSMVTNLRNGTTFDRDEVSITCRIPKPGQVITMVVY